MCRGGLGQAALAELDKTHVAMRTDPEQLDLTGALGQSDDLAQDPSDLGESFGAGP